MAFNPTSTIYLCNVPIDNTYKNQLYFDTPSQQNAYFSGRVVKHFANYLTVRKSLPDGSLQSSVKVDANIDDLYTCNYMYYQNQNHGTKYFYAFITNLIYVNEGTTEIVFETDVWQTWFNNITIKESYVVREHSETDEIGDNIVPEKFAYKDYVYRTLITDHTLENLGYLITTSSDDFDKSWWNETFGGEGINIDGCEHSGIYQGTYYFYFRSASKINEFLNKAMTKQGNCIFSITVIPDFSISGVSGDYRAVIPSDKPNKKEIEISILNSVDLKLFADHIPKNNKLLTSPFLNLIVSNFSGSQAEYNIEDFDFPKRITFDMYGDVSPNPTVTLVPKWYKGLADNYDAGISLAGFPQCSFNGDTYKLWLTKNKSTNITSAAMGVLGIVGGGALIATGAGAGAGVATMVSGASKIMGTINNSVQASYSPNSFHSGNEMNNLITGMGENKFHYYIRSIKAEYAEIIDDYFTMFGYQTNRVKIPNISKRPYFNYVETADVNIVGAIPNDDMQKLKRMFNSGVTFWKDASKVGNYSVDNSV